MKRKLKRKMFFERNNGDFDVVHCNNGNDVMWKGGGSDGHDDDGHLQDIDAQFDSHSFCTVKMTISTAMSSMKCC